MLDGIVNNCRGGKGVLVNTCKESFLNAWVDYIIFQQIRFKTFCENLVIQFGDDR